MMTGCKAVCFSPVYVIYQAPVFDAAFSVAPVGDITLSLMLTDCSASDASFYAADNSADDSADPVVMPASELIDIGHQVHQQLINLVVRQLCNCCQHCTVSIC